MKQDEMLQQLLKGQSDLSKKLGSVEKKLGSLEDGQKQIKEEMRNFREETSDNFNHQENLLQQGFEAISNQDWRIIRLETQNPLSPWQKKKKR